MSSSKTNEMPGNALALRVSSTLTANLALMFISMLRPLLITRLLGPVGKGELVALVAWPLFLAEIGAIGIPEAIIYFSSREKMPLRVLKTALAIMAPLAIVTIAIGYFLIPILARNQSAEIVRASQIYLCMIPLDFVSIAVFRYYQSGKPALWNRLRILKPLAYLIGVGIAWAFLTVDAVTISYIWILLNFVVMAYTLLTVRRSGSLRRTPMKKEIAGGLLRFGAQSAVGRVPVLLNNRVDQLIMVSIVSAAALGFYSTAVSWSLFLAPISRTINQVMFPYIAQTNDDIQATRRFAVGLQAGVIVNLVTCLFMVVITPLLFTLVFGEEFRPALPSAYVLLGAAFFWQTNQNIQSGLNGVGLPIFRCVFRGSRACRYPSFARTLVAQVWNFGRCNCFADCLLDQFGRLALVHQSQVKIWGFRIAKAGSFIVHQFETCRSPAYALKQNEYKSWKNYLVSKPGGVYR